LHVHTNAAYTPLCFVCPPTEQTGYSFGYGFVDYKTESDSEDAIQKLNGFYVRNKRLKVR